MEIYEINGVEVEYDTFDLVNIELFQSEAERVAEVIRSNRKTDTLSVLRANCEAMRDFFDTVVGDGTSNKCFGARMNVRDILTAYSKFVEDVSKEIASFNKSMAQDASALKSAATAPVNRDQRRAEERAKRRAEAAARAVKKSKNLAMNYATESI